MTDVSGLPNTADESADGAASKDQTLDATASVREQYPQLAPLLDVLDAATAHKSSSSSGPDSPDSSESPDLADSSAPSDFAAQACEPSSEQGEHPALAVALDERYGDVLQGVLQDMQRTLDALKRED